MGKVKTTCRVDVYDDPAKSSIKIDSHWHDRDRIVIAIGEEARTVLGKDLKTAIDNCMNT